MINQKELNAVYERYGFEERPSGENGVFVYTLKAGHFHNADIISTKNDAKDEKVFSNFKASGFACKIRKYNDISDVEKTLFRGFFTVKSTKSRLYKEYEKFTTSIISAYSDDASYSYIQSKYFINGSVGETDVVSEVLSRIKSDNPILFLIEAAAGFGKTCTAFELLSRLLDSDSSKIPLFSELSRNRQAKIFRYVLLDEIDRSFPLLSSSLVRSEIINGNVPVILDGFDELLHRSEDKDGYENTEPMLNTIGELLHKKAKVILTTRRTAIFDGDEFHDWMSSHEDDFEVFRIRIDEPTVSDWLSSERFCGLKSANFPIEKLSNPVLLSYLKCISDSEFNNAIRSSDKIVEKYFTSMLERERIRQDLRMQPKDQYSVMKYIAKDMIRLNYTSETREYIIGIIRDKYIGDLEGMRRLYPADERPTTDELINKLASHALLDRSSDSNQGIGFVNEFVLGNFCADLILEDTFYEWSDDQRFIEPAVLSYMPRSRIRKYSLWLATKFCLEFGEFTQKVVSTISLTEELDIDIVNQSIDNIRISGVDLSKNRKIKNSIFINCIFSNVKFFQKNMENVTFANCEFYKCFLQGAIRGKSINMLGCLSDEDDFLESFIDKVNVSHNGNSTELSESEVYILEKFWPVGRPTFTKHRPIKGICAKSNRFIHTEILFAINSLKKKKILLNPTKCEFLELNMDKIPEIKSLLGRD